MVYSPQAIVITGATSGFGYEAAKAFAKACPQSRLILTGRRQERLEALSSELSVPVHILVQDVSDTNKVVADFSALPDEFSNVDLLINNAGLALGTEAMPEKILEDSLRIVDTNVRGLLAVTHALLPGMVERKRGHIINIGSVAGTYPYPGGNTYCGSKAFVNHFSKTLRADLKGKNVRVSSLEPGSVDSEFSLVRFKGDQAKANAVYEGYRKMSSSEIADIIVWLAMQPEHININNLEVMPTDQSFNSFDFKAVEED